MSKPTNKTKATEIDADLVYSKVKCIKSNFKVDSKMNFSKK